MRGVSYLVDEAGKKTAVILDLRKHRRLWEDIHDRLLIESRRREPRESLEQVKRRLARRESPCLIIASRSLLRRETNSSGSTGP